MTYHLFGNIITAQGISANNRGENEGNRTTLPKVFWGDKLHVSVSAEAIRWAIRYYWQTMNIPVNRVWLEEDQDVILTLAKEKMKYDPERFIDDDVMGYMEATSGKGNEAVKRRGVLEVTRAVSLQSADRIEFTFNAKSGKKLPKPKKDKSSDDNSDGKKVSKQEKKKGNSSDEDNCESEGSKNSKISLYSTENITTRFQYGFAITPSSLKVPTRVIDVLNAVTKLHNVGGNHGRFLYDFSPVLAIFRWTHHPVPQFLYCFEQPDADTLTVPRLQRLIEVEEIPAKEIWICGDDYTFAEDIKPLKAKGVNVYPSLQKGVKMLTERITKDLGL